MARAAQPQPPQRKKPSMYDVARAAGVSQTTVSLVVNDAPNANIPEVTRARIWAVVHELGVGCDQALDRPVARLLIGCTHPTRA